MVPAQKPDSWSARTIDWSSPFVVCAEDAEALLGGLLTDTIFCKEVNESKNAFLASDERRLPAKGKGKIPFVDPALQQRVADVLHAFLPEGSLHVSDTDSADASSDTKKLAKLMQPDFLATKGQKVHPIFENASLPTLRLFTSGVRQTIFIKFSAIGEHVRAQLGGQAMKHPLSSMGTIQWLTNCGHEKLTEWAESAFAPIFKCCNSVGDVVYTPAGWIKIEHGNEDALVVKQTILPCNAFKQAVCDLRIASADLLAQGRKSAGIDIALKMMTDMIEDCQRLLPALPALPPPQNANAETALPAQELAAPPAQELAAPQADVDPGKPADLQLQDASELAGRPGGLFRKSPSCRFLE